MTLPSYDIAIIGAGPAAVAALSVLPSGATLAVVTGASSAMAVDSGRTHPKIDAVANARREQKGVSAPLPFPEARSGALFPTAAVGGLANYWGQQFVRYEANDPWPRHIFGDHAGYLDDCARIEGLFDCSPGAATLPTSDGPYVLRTPNLLVGPKGNATLGLEAMAQIFERLCTAKSAQRYDQTAVSLEKTGDAVRINLSGGKSILASRVILAAGVVGSLLLAAQSCADIRTVRLQDHAPHMFYFLRAPGKWSLRRSDGLRHFNALTVERVYEDRVSLFASVYRMSQAPIGLLLASLGLPPYFPRTYPPGLVDFCLPVQIWTSDTRMSYRIDTRTRRAIREDPTGGLQDDALNSFTSWLSRRGFIAKRSQTAPGFGFHFHAGEVSRDDGGYQSLNEFLAARFDGRVLCVDGSALDRIGPRPPTLTAMAAAARLVDDADWG